VVGVLLGTVYKERVDVTNSFAGKKRRRKKKKKEEEEKKKKRRRRRRMRNKKKRKRTYTMELWCLHDDGGVVMAA